MFWRKEAEKHEAKGNTDEQIKQRSREGGGKNREIKSLGYPEGLNARCMLQLITITFDQSNLWAHYERKKLSVKQITVKRRGLGKNGEELFSISINNKCELIIVYYLTVLQPTVGSINTNTCRMAKMFKPKGLIKLNEIVVNSSPSMTQLQRLDGRSR